MTQEETINQLSEACQDLMQMVNDLKEENTFLTDTIVNAKMGKIATERRKLLAKVMKSDASAQKSISEANAIKSEYGQKLDKITILIKDVKSKQNDIDSYIDSESDAKITDIKKTLNAKYKQKQSELENEYLQKESACEAKTLKYKHFMIAAMIGMLIAIVSAFIGIKALLLLIVVDVIVSIWLSFRKRG